MQMTSNVPFQRMLRLLMRAFIGCWIGAYMVVYQETHFGSYFQYVIQNWFYSGFSKAATVWAMSIFFFVPVTAAVYWIQNRGGLWIKTGSEDPPKDSA